MRRFALALLVSLLAPAQSTVRVYVYAQSESPARAWLPVFCNGIVVAEVRRGTFFAMDLVPGSHTFSLEAGVPLSVVLRPENNAHIRVDWKHQLGRPPIPALSAVPQARGEEEMMFLGYVPAKRLHSTAALKADPRPSDQPTLRTRGTP